MIGCFIWIKIFYGFWNVIFSKGDRRKTVICPFKRISINFATIVDYSALFSHHHKKRKVSYDYGLAKKLKDLRSQLSL